MMAPDHLSELFQRYRRSCPEPEGSADFMPRLWQRIDSRRGVTGRLRSYSRLIAAAAATLCLSLVLFDMSPLAQHPSLFNETYVDALDDDNAPEAFAFADVVDSTPQEANR